MFISETAIVEKNVSIGNGSRIWDFVHLREGSRLGVSCSIGEGSVIGCKVLIGDFVDIAAGVNIPEGVIIKDRVFIGSNVSFKNVKYPKPRVIRKYTLSKIIPTIVEEGAVVDANACINPGVIIGKKASIGAGAIITKDVHEGGFFVNIPAQCMCGREDCPDALRYKKKRNRMYNAIKGNLLKELKHGEQKS